MNRKLILLIAIVALTAMPAWAGKNLGELFVDAPIEQLQSLTPSQRLSMIIKSGQGEARPTVESRMDETATLNALDSNYIDLNTSAAKRVEMRLFATKNDTIIVVIETVYAPAPDSRVACFNAAWQPIAAGKVFTVPQLDNFIAKHIPADVANDLHEAVPFSLVELRFADNRTDIVARHSLKQFLTESDFKRFAPYLTEQITYQFNGKKFKTR